MNDDNKGVLMICFIVIYIIGVVTCLSNSVIYAVTADSLHLSLAWDLALLGWVIVSGLIMAILFKGEEGK